MADGTIAHFLILNKTLGYALLFFFLLLEGELIFFVAAFLAHRGFFDPLTLMAIALAGVLIGDVLWFTTGRNMHKTSKLFQFAARHISRAFDSHVERVPMRVLFISKFTYGLHRAVLLRIGNTKMSLKTFLRGDILPSVVWVVTVFMLGYISSLTLVPLRHYLRFAEIGLAVVVISFAVLSYALSRVLRRKL